MSVPVEKELHDVGLAVCNLVVKLVQKKSMAEIIASELPLLQDAVVGLGDADMSNVEACTNAFTLPVANMIGEIVKSQKV